MAQLILTDAEKTAELWTDLDDQALGALLRKKLIIFKTAAEQMDRTITMTAALLLCCDAAEAGASELTVNVEGVTQAGRDFGDWQIVAVRKLPAAEPWTAKAKGLLSEDGQPCPNDHDPDCRWPNCLCREPRPRHEPPNVEANRPLPATEVK